jgi:membrane dipeptidase
LRPVELHWHDLRTRLADLWDGAEVEISGWVLPIDGTERHQYFALVAEWTCCVGCLPSDPTARLEVFPAEPVLLPRGLVRLGGRWRRLVDDPAGWRYQLRDARFVGTESPAPMSRRTLLSAGPLAAIAISLQTTDLRADPTPDTSSIAAPPLLGGTPTIDIHSHAGHFIRENTAPEAVADPMRAGGLAVACLAIVADSPTHRVFPDGRIHPTRAPEPGELYAWSKAAFARLLRLAQAQQLHVIGTTAQLRAALIAGPSIIVTAEGGDFIEDRIERVDEARTLYGLRHLQLTHYRPNELGDIQTEDPIQGGLTDFGAAVIRTCNRLGIVVDVAHGTYDLVKRAVAVTTRPLVLSHTSLTQTPGRYSRQISPDHARLVAQTGGVIGIWPPASIFPALDDMAVGFARMADVVGVDHVGLGSDMRGLTSRSVLDSYRDFPLLAEKLLARGFAAVEVGKMLGGNYARVFTATVG